MLPLQGGVGSIPGQGQKILHAMQHGWPKKKKKNCAVMFLN